VCERSVRKAATQAGLRNVLCQPKPRKAVVFSDEKYFRIGGTPRTAWIGIYDDPPHMMLRCVSIHVFTVVVPRRSAEKVYPTDPNTFRKIKPLSTTACAFWLHLVQDGASSHTAKIVTNWLEEQPFERMTQWPPHSPDLNPIENVWGIMAQRMARRDMHTKEELKAAIIEEWNAIDFALIRALYDSMPARYEQVIRLAGGNTKY